MAVADILQQMGDTCDTVKELFVKSKTGLQAVAQYHDEMEGCTMRFLKKWNVWLKRLPMAGATGIQGCQCPMCTYLRATNSIVGDK